MERQQVKKERRREENHQAGQITPTPAPKYRKPAQSTPSQRFLGKEASEQMRRGEMDREQQELRDAKGD